MTQEEEQALIAAAKEPPRLQAGEKIRVIVFGESSLTGDYQIDPSGLLSLPLAGTVKAVGLTQVELEEVLSKKFAGGYLKDPKVTIGITEFRPFYVLGEVEKPGVYPYTSGLNILSALAIAGGSTYRASQSRVLIQHAVDTSPREYQMNAAIPIFPGDIIQVPRRYF